MAFTKPCFLVLLLSATLLAEAQIPGFGLDPSAPSQFPSLGNLQQCWMSLEEITGCNAEVYRAFFTGKVGLEAVGPSCCMAIKDITSHCWSQMFPNTPSFPSLLSSYCANFQTGQADAPAPSLEPADLLIE
ncbi:egg cell-secreted protein 1.2-like [Bidens hawaiensis]|uniref:egg cell-secreted protein 1.2-like n=1 Tax=Bidens hawaiensis TaxID=980011 RepID=UPI00404AE568